MNRAANARNQQLSMAKAYVQELQNPDHWQQHLEEHNSPGIFIPGGNAKHKAGRGTGIQGSYVGVGRAKETNIVRGRGRGRGRGRPLKPNNSSSIDDVMRRGEELLKNSNNPTTSSGENTCTNYDRKTNPPNIALFLGLNISRCQGCRGVIDRKVLQSPKDIAIRCKDLRSYTDPKTNTTKTTYGNIYFHLDLKYIQKKYPQAVLEDIVAANDTMALLSDAHLMHLKIQLGS